jgi:LuxR family maltose regulon positive regulatory protein
VQEVVSVRNRARFVRPKPLQPTVERTRLDPLYAESSGRILRVIAPPGYGKSTQVTRWVAGEGRHVGWVDLERIDNDPSVLAAALAHALTGGGGRTEPPEELNGPVANLAPKVGAFIAAIDRPFVLVLDDAHHVDSPSSLAVLDAVADHLPPGSTLVLSGRSHADHGSLARHRLRPGVVDVSSSHLALDATETDELLASMDVHLGLDALNQVCALFEGWAAGIRLAGLALRSDADPDWLSLERVGDSTYVVDYLRSEWTGQLRPADRRLLREAACLDRFTGEMCDVILERSGSSAQLRHLHREELLLLPLDQRDEWFRMHPLLTRWLSSELLEADPDRFKTIHTKAARWWSERGDIDLAFDHAIAAPDLRAAEILASQHGVPYLSRSLGATVGRWLAAFPNDVVRSSGGLCAVHAIGALQQGDSARALHWYHQLEHVLSSGAQGAPASDELRHRAAALRVTLSPEPAAVLLPIAEELGKEHDGDAWGSLGLMGLGGLRFLTGDDRSAESFAEAAFVAELDELIFHRANCIAAGAIVLDLQGDQERAAREAHAAAEILQGRTDLPATTALVNAMLAVIEARAGHRERAAGHLQEGRLKLVDMHAVAPWFNVLGRLALTRAALLIDDRTTSRSMLQELEHDLRAEPPDNGASAHVAILRERIDAARRLPADQAWALTEAELRVLQFLPTNLALADIAIRLFVSRNTVKSHVASIYRKLGVTSRSEAVDLARSTGLLQDDAD